MGPNGILTYCAARLAVSRLLYIMKALFQDDSINEHSPHSVSRSLIAISLCFHHHLNAESNYCFSNTKYQYRAEQEQSHSANLGHRLKFSS